MREFLNSSQTELFFIEALPPEDEEQRLEALHQLRVLDTAPEVAFDAITQLAAEVFSVPIAAVSLIDTDRQWFKSVVGLSVSETPRDIAFCAHAIHAPGGLIVEDTWRDRRFRGNPLVIGAPYIRFYAASVLRGLDGRALGTLCIIDDRPRHFGAADQGRLAVLGRQAALLLTRGARVPARGEGAEGDQDGFIGCELSLSAPLISLRRRPGRGR